MTKISRLITIFTFVFFLGQSGNTYGQIFLIPIDSPDKKQEVQKFLDAHPELITKFYDLISLLSRVENFYVDEKSKEELMNLAMKGVVSGLDSYSHLLIDKEASNAFKSFGSEDEYVGVGMSIIKQGRNCVITSVFKNSPAQKGGLEPGDIILKVDNQDVSGLSSYDIRSLIRGDKDTAVLIEIRSTRLQKPRTVKLVRADVVYLSVDTTKLGNYGYIKINRFVEKTPARMKEALRRFHNKKGLIIDLRDNPGGLVSSLNEIMGLFVGSDEIIIIMKGRNEQFNREIRTDVKKEKYPPKVVVLVNNFSASASEIMAGTLQYYKVAKIVGVRTFGKAVGQSVMGLARDDAGDIRLLLHLTTFRYYLPDGKSVLDSGIVPDIEVEQPDGFRIYEYGTQRDQQLQKALEFLNKK